MDAVGNPIDIRSLGAGPLENAMERDDAPGVEINSRAPDCLDIWLQHFVSFRRSRRPDHARFAKDDCRVGTSAPEPVKDLPIDLRKSGDRRPAARACQSVPDIVDANLYGNQLGLLAMTSIPTAAEDPRWYSPKYLC